jgi:UDP-N-acetylglucosamine 2-epimerase (non-hydrolysing)
MPATICHITGTRPNFIKAAPLFEALQDTVFNQIVVHSGQHYDAALNDPFFGLGGLKPPDIVLNVPQLPPDDQEMWFFERFKQFYTSNKLDLVVVYGDVTTTVAAALAAEASGIPVAHVEAGCRSGNLQMREEQNRIKTDAVSDLLFTPDEAAVRNLKNESVRGRILNTGNIVADVLLKSGLQPRIFKLESGKILLTLHRAEVVDNEILLRTLVNKLQHLSERWEIIWPLHPRTAKNLSAFSIKLPPEIRVVPPLPHLELLQVLLKSDLLLTDSGGLQFESSWLNVPTITLRAETEHTNTLHFGTNVLCEPPFERLPGLIATQLSCTAHFAKRPEADGFAARRIAEAIESFLANPA